MENENGYLSLLPNEILIKILNYLSTFDLIQYCKAYPQQDYFLRDRATIGKIDLFQSYKKQEINVPRFLTSKISYECVTCLNVNSVYWVKAFVLRKCVKMMVNLENLFILDTKLFLTERNGHCLQSLTKLQKLAITVDGLILDTETIASIPRVKSLMLSIIGKKSRISRELSEISFHRELKELWVIDYSGNWFFDIYFLLSHKNIERFVLYNSYLFTHLPINNYEAIKLYKIHENRRLGYIFLENASPLVNRENLIEAFDNSYKSFISTWSHLSKFEPFGINDARKLLTYDGTSTKNLYFEELNLCHEQLSCSRRCCASIHSCLNSEFTKNIEKLSVQWCVFNEERSGENNIAYNGNKRRRVQDKRSYFQITGDYFKKLEELEIGQCARIYTGDSLINGLNDISSFKLLKKLSVVVPLDCDGSFLLKVFKKCVHLESLRIKTPVSNEKLTLSLCSSIKYASALKDLRYEYYFSIKIDNVFESLSKLPNKKLERLLIKCKRVDKFSEKPLINFLNKNPQLIFLFVSVTELADRDLKEVKRTLQTCRKGHPEKVFFIKKNVSNTYYRMFIPSIHYEDLVQNHSNVSTVDIHKYFMKPYKIS